MPSRRSARLWYEAAPPGAMAAQSRDVPTCVGLCLSAVSPTPSWPKLFSPHAQSVPSRFSARLWWPRQEAAAQSVALPTCVGLRRGVVSPTPS